METREQATEWMRMILDTRQSGCVVRRRGRRLKDGPGIATMATVSVCTSWPAVMRRCAGRQAKVAGAAKVVKPPWRLRPMKSPASCRKRSRADAAAAVEGGLIRAAFLAGVAQHRRLKTVDAAGFPDEGEFRWEEGPCWLRAPMPSRPEIGVGGLGGAGALMARRPGGVRRSGPAAPPAG